MACPASDLSALSRRTAPSLAWLWLIALLFCHAAAAQDDTRWVGTWEQAMTSNFRSRPATDGKSQLDDYGQPELTIPTRGDFTLRQLAVVSLGGSRVRIRLSNYFGRHPLTVDAAHVGLSAGHAGDPSAIRPGSDRRLRFDGKRSVTIAPGEMAVSDPVDLTLPALSTVAVSLYFAHSVELADVHPLQRMASTFAVSGDASALDSFGKRPSLGDPSGDRGHHVYLLTGIEVPAATGTRGIVTLGDSITDGYLASAPANSWPGVLSRLIHQDQRKAAVANAGISADELTTDQIGDPGAGMSGLKRYLRDVVDRPGVTDVVVLFGTNDLNRGIDPAGQPGGVSSGDLIAGLRMLADVAHQHHLHVVAATIPPLAGEPGLYSPRREATRLQTNRWIRSSGTFDDVVDFSAVLAGAYKAPALVAKSDPLPAGMASVCAGDEGLHPNDRGYAVMGTLVYDTLFHAHAKPAQECH